VFTNKDRCSDWHIGQIVNVPEPWAVSAEHVFAIAQATVLPFWTLPTTLDFYCVDLKVDVLPLQLESFILTQPNDNFPPCPVSPGRWP